MLINVWNVTLGLEQTETLKQRIQMVGGEIFVEHCFSWDADDILFSSSLFLKRFRNDKKQG